MGKLLAAVLLCMAGAAGAVACPPPGQSRDSLQALREAGFVVEDAEARQSLALALADCLAHPDPALRDGVAFEALSKWMRESLLEAPTVHALYSALLPRLSAPDAEGYARPFAALVLAEVARVDRLQPFLGDGERMALVGAAAAYLHGVDDYRGFDPQQGWRHGVAHGADLALQLVLNAAVGREAIDMLLDAVAVQVAPAGTHSYVFGEPQRLALPVLFAAKRALHEAAFWQAWFERIAAPAPLEAWDQAFGSLQGLAKRHNTHAFLLAVYVNAKESSDPNVQVLAGPALEALKRLP